jgi:hypothetical protein
MAMHVSIQLVKKDDTVQRTLQKDGWDLQSDEKSEEMRAKHPQVHQESDARRRLHDIGLLTCRTCRIEFRH